MRIFGIQALVKRLRPAVRRARGWARRVEYQVGTEDSNCQKVGGIGEVRMPAEDMQRLVAGQLAEARKAPDSTTWTSAMTPISASCAWTSLAMMPGLGR